MASKSYAERFVAKLEDLGGATSNAAMVAGPGWGEDTHDRVKAEFLDAIKDALDAHQTMNRQALGRSRPRPALRGATKPRRDPR